MIFYYLTTIMGIMHPENAVFILKKELDFFNTIK